MDRLFRPVKGFRRSKEIIDRIQEAILAGRLNKGQKLPPERKLQTIFKTSRPTIREALRVLEYNGFIRIELGKNGGIFINSDPMILLPRNLGLYMRSRNFSTYDLAEFREKLEGDVAEIAVNKASVSDIVHLEKILRKAETCLWEDPLPIHRFIAADAKFHLKLSKIAGNSLYVYMLAAIYNLRPYYERFYTLKHDLLEKNLRDLYGILDAFTEHHPEKVKTLSINHIRKFNIEATFSVEDT